MVADADGELVTVDEGVLAEAVLVEELPEDKAVFLETDVEDESTVLTAVEVGTTVVVVEMTVIFAEAVATAREVEAAAVLSTLPPGASYWKYISVS